MSCWLRADIEAALHLRARRSAANAGRKCADFTRVRVRSNLFQQEKDIRSIGLGTNRSEGVEEGWIVAQISDGGEGEARVFIHVIVHQPLQLSNIAQLELVISQLYVFGVWWKPTILE